MAIVLGDNGYISVAGFKAWADARAYDYSSYTDPQIEAAITISGVDFIDANYTFKGVKQDETQAMQLPTDEVEIADIENGAAQAVWSQLQGQIFVNAADIQQSGAVKRQRDKVGSLETETEYADGGSYTYTYPTARIDNLLRPYLQNSSQFGSVGIW